MKKEGRMGRRFLVFAMMLGLGFAAAAQAGDAPSSLAYLAKWEGNYPSMTRKPLKSLPVGERFWDDANVLAVMKKNLPLDVMKKIILGWSGNGEAVEVPILKQNNILFVSVCKPHECVDNAARLFFNLEKKTVQVCWTETDPKTRRQMSVWIADKVTRLAPDACLRNEGFEAFRAFGKQGH